MIRNAIVANVRLISGLVNIGMASLVTDRLATITSVGQGDTSVPASPIISGLEQPGRANSVSHGADDIWNGRPSAFPQLSEADGKVPRLVVPSFSLSRL